MNRTPRFLRVILPLIFLLFYSYIAHQLLRFAKFPLPVFLGIMLWLAVIVLGVLILPLFFWFKNLRRENKNDVLLQKAAYLCQGYFSYLLTIIFLRDFFSFFTFSLTNFFNFDFIFFNYNEIETVVILLMPFAFMFFGRIPIEIGPRLTEIPIDLFLKKKKKSENTQQLKILQISDLHIGPGITLQRIQRIINQANSIEPDLVVLTGDIIDHTNHWFEKEINELQKFKTKYGIYFVPGNHEYYWGFESNIKKLQEIGIKVLLNSNERIKIGATNFAVCGVTDPAARMFDLELPNLEKSLVGVESEDIKILLAHQPGIADEAARLGFDLQLSGHTHGGQFIPWSLMIGLFHKYPKGYYNLKTMQLYVSQGTGHWGPADRLGTWGEVSLIRVNF